MSRTYNPVPTCPTCKTRHMSLDAAVKCCGWVNPQLRKPDEQIIRSAPGMANMIDGAGAVTLAVSADKYHELQARYDAAIQRLMLIQEAIIDHNVAAGGEIKPMARHHYFGAQTIPINRNRVVCLHCGKVRRIADMPTGRRAKCSPTLKYENLPNAGCASRSTATGKLRITSRGHAEYRVSLAQSQHKG